MTNRDVSNRKPILEWVSRDGADGSVRLEWQRSTQEEKKKISETDVGVFRILASPFLEPFLPRDILEDA